MRRRVATVLFSLALGLLPAAGAAVGGWADAFAPPPGGQGLDDRIDALCLWNDEIHAGGQFILAGQDSAWGIARWDSAGWRNLAGGMNGRVSALAVWRDELVAGGLFTSAGGTPVRYVAAWDGAGWRPLGDPAAWAWSDVLALCVQDTVLWAAGSGFVVRFDGSGWQAVTGVGFGGDVFALASFGGELVAGGAFTSISDPSGTTVAASRIAAWDGTAWRPLGGGADGTVYALSVWNGQLVAGGVFSSPAPIVAAWNGTGWFGLGDGLDGTAVVALAPWGNRLVCGGDFTGSGTTALRRIALFDGTGWSPLDGGVNGLVRAVLGSGAAVWAGGDFTWADTLASSHVGRWDDPLSAAPDGAPPAPVLLGDPYPNPFNPRVAIPVTVLRPGAVALTVHDLAGRLVRTLWRGELPAGTRVLEWDGRDGSGQEVAGGVYVFRLDAATTSDRRSVVLVR